MFVRIPGTVYLEHNFSKGRVRIWFFGIDWFQIAAIVKWPLVTRLLGEGPQGSFSGREAIEGYITDLFQRHNPSDRVTKMSYVYAFGGDLCALGGWTVTIDGSRKFGGYLVIVYTFVGGTWKIRSSVSEDFIS